MKMNERKVTGTFQQRRDTVESWESKNPVLLDGEMVTVVCSDGVIRHKTGYGGKRYNELPFDNFNGSSSSILVEAVLMQNAWSDNEQTITDHRFGSERNGIIGISDAATDEQMTAAANANLVISNQDKNSLIVHADGQIPDCDIPVSIVLLPTDNSSHMVYITLEASAWSNNQQTVRVDGLSEKQNGVISIARYATDEQIKAAKEANLRVADQSDGSITILASGNLPACNIPVTIMLIP